MKNWYKNTKRMLLIAIAILFVLMLLLLGLVTFDQNTIWFSTLNMPSIQPPSWIFILVWSVLYFLIALSVVLVLDKPKKNKDRTMTLMLFVLNGILNALYSIFFFGMKSILLAFLELPLLIASVLLLIWCTYRVDKKAAYLLVPYFIWICFATVLTGITLFIN
ncbi:tryptophan-rich sensory protein [Candidatus Peregrinibacteria bacterium]|nr:tryptophan-rich sensory protein [Candidatus Peregrinibacteria bacterium]